MATVGHFGFGAILTIGTEVVAGVKTLTGPSISMETLDITSHGSTAPWKEFCAGLRDGGEVKVEGNFKNGATANSSMLTFLNSGDVKSVTFEMPATSDAAHGSTWTFDALVTAYELTDPYDNLMTFSCTLKVSGQPTLVDDAS